MHAHARQQMERWKSGGCVAVLHTETTVLWAEVDWWEKLSPCLHNRSLEGQLCADSASARWAAARRCHHTCTLCYHPRRRCRQVREREVGRVCVDSLRAARFLVMHCSLGSSMCFCSHSFLWSGCWCGAQLQHHCFLGWSAEHINFEGSQCVATGSQLESF